ncbi:uncharacterized protein MYCGRDRAFT_91287 [Zymoseptoria tritici IPO323]|uniref:Uncharacterized protein n=1 Tax=Zymoseptoria tritici (strain CBS 115943 / IPO323) TaxID=336722 RepID=F9X505_ZYMTI|nr:uncharacterized protein MYCGRDRAFT_91287 [Zymoseptoria tritici IPO323]EGP90203.1 hypothetical protein MYCGRDRAFT_91287 [Zymoseptoria tritici IPO323]
MATPETIPFPASEDRKRRAEDPSVDTISTKKVRADDHQQEQRSNAVVPPPSVDIVSTKKVQPYDHQQERWFSAVALTKAWATLEDGRRRIYELITEPFELAKHRDQYTERHVKSCKDTLLYIKQESITVGISGGSVEDRDSTLKSLLHHFEDPLRKLGVIMVDAAERQAAGHLIILTDVAGSKDDPVVSEQVKAMCALGNKRVVVVVPHPDKVDGDAGLAQTQDQANKILELLAECARLRSLVDNIDNRIVGYEEAGNFAQAGKDGQEKRKAEVQAKLADNKLEAYRLGLRNKHNAAVVVENLAKSCKAAALVPVLYIANGPYAEHLAGHSTKASPMLSVEQTNIPKLRGLIASFPNEVLLKEARLRQNTAIPELFMRLHSYASGEVRERKLDLDVHLKFPESQSDRLIQQHFEQLGRKLRSAINTAVKDKVQGWATQAGILCTKYEAQVSSDVFLTIMKRHGRRPSSGGRPPIDMSSDLVGISSSTMQHIFGRPVDLVVHKFVRSLTRDIDTLSGNLASKLQDTFSVNFDASIRSLNRAKTRFQISVETTTSNILGGMKELERKACAPGEDTYLLTAMVPIYEQVWQLQVNAIDPVTKEKTKEKNRDPRPPEGWANARKAAIRKGVAQVDGVWATVRGLMNQELETLLSEQMTALQKEICTAFQAFRREFDTTCADKFGSSPAELELQQALLENLEKAREHLLGPMRRAFDALEKDPKYR